MEQAFVVVRVPMDQDTVHGRRCRSAGIVHGRRQDITGTHHHFWTRLRLARPASSCGASKLSGVPQCIMLQAKARASSCAHAALAAAPSPTLPIKACAGRVRRAVQ